MSNALTLIPIPFLSQLDEFERCLMKMMMEEFENN